MGLACSGDPCLCYVQAIICRILYLLVNNLSLQPHHPLLVLVVVFLEQRHSLIKQSLILSKTLLGAILVTGYKMIHPHHLCRTHKTYFKISVTLSKPLCKCITFLGNTSVSCLWMSLQATLLLVQVDPDIFVCQNASISSHSSCYIYVESQRINAGNYSLITNQ